MTFELTRGRPLRKDIRQIVRKQVEAGIDELTSESANSDEVVHEVRKRLKRLRAMLRLVRAGMSRQTYHIENKRLRDIARPLREVRDAKVLLETLDNLVERFKESLVDESFPETRQALEKNLLSIRKRVLQQEHAFRTAEQLLRDAGRRVKFWVKVSDHWSALEPGLKQTYAKARQTCRRACSDPSVERLHEWRKQIKYLRHQVEILKPLCPDRLSNFRDELEELGELLGQDHDLVVLHETLLQSTLEAVSTTERNLLISIIERRQAELQRQAERMGAFLFEERPSAYMHRFKKDWKTWRQTSTDLCKHPN